jgi:hypothetical protein
MIPFPEKTVTSLFHLAGIEVYELLQLENHYWPSAYAAEAAVSPWWEVFSEIGRIRIGWRKRVISISWESTDIRSILTEDDVTKSETLVHAWGYPKAIEYLQHLKAQGMMARNNLLKVELNEFTQHIDLYLMDVADKGKIALTDNGEIKFYLLSEKEYNQLKLGFKNS